MHHENASDTYLETTVMSASPARLRLMTIEVALQKATQAIGAAQELGRVEPNEHTVTLRDALDELLAGIAPSEDHLPHQVADLYVFLIQWLTTAETEGEVQKLIDIRRVLEIEGDTWKQLCEGQVSPAAATSLHMHSAPSLDPAPLDSVSFEA